jgi:hypothetical protein
MVTRNVEQTIDWNESLGVMQAKVATASLSELSRVSIDERSVNDVAVTHLTSEPEVDLSIFLKQRKVNGEKW